jgi:hypothetical protein
MPTILTPRPPLNLFEAIRVNIANPDGVTWTTIYQTPLYRVPASGPDPQRDIPAAAIMTGVIVANTSVVPILLSARILDTVGNPFSLLTDIQVPVGDYILLDMDRQVLKTDETLQLQCGQATTATAHFSFILNQREEFTVIT